MSKIVGGAAMVLIWLLIVGAFAGLWWIERHLPCWMYEARNAPVHCLPGGGR